MFKSMGIFMRVQGSNLVRFRKPRYETYPAHVPSSAAEQAQQSMGVIIGHVKWLKNAC